MLWVSSPLIQIAFGKEQYLFFTCRSYSFKNAKNLSSKPLSSTTVRNIIDAATNRKADVLKVLLTQLLPIVLPRTGTVTTVSCVSASVEVAHLTQVFPVAELAGPAHGGLLQTLGGTVALHPLAIVLQTVSFLAIATEVEYRRAELARF